MRVYLLDDEPLAVRRLARLLEPAVAAGRVTIAGSSTNPVEAVAWLNEHPGGMDALLLDIEMPGLSGFEVLARLETPPLVVFTTAYEQYALRAFQANSIDYLLKPVEPGQLERALAKLERMLGAAAPPPQNIAGLLELLLVKRLTRLASRVGDKVVFVDAADVTHLFSKDKLTFAASAGGRQYAVDQTIQELEERLDPASFIRIHRSTIVNIAAIKELHSWFGGRLVVRLKDGQTELPVARERTAELKKRLGVAD